MVSLSHTSTTIRKANTNDFILLVFCAMVWGSAFMMMKIAVQEVEPLTVATGRVLIGAIVLLLYALLRGRQFPADIKTWRLLLLVGMMGSGIPFFLITWAEQVIDSGMAAILMSAGPIFSLLFAHVFTTDDKFTWNKLAGIIIGLLGVIIVIGFDVLNGIGENLLPQIALMLAAFCYAATGVAIRRVNDMKPDMLVACSLLMATAVMLPLSLLIDQPWKLWTQHQAPGAAALMAIVYLGIIPTACAFFIRARIVMTVGYTFFSMVGYLVPVFAVFFGALFLNEAVKIQALIALSMVLCGIGITQMRSKS